MKKHELYNITLKGGKVLFSVLTQMEYFERMEDLAIEFYQTGTPHPNAIVTESYLEENGN